MKGQCHPKARCNGFSRQMLAGLLALVLGTPMAQSAEVYFNQNGGKELGTRIMEAMEEAVLGAQGRPVTLDALIFQFTTEEIADKMLSLAANNPNVTIRMVTDWTSLSEHSARNRPPYMEYAAAGNYNRACSAVTKNPTDATACRTKLQNLLGGQTLNNVDIRFKKDEPYYWNENKKKVSYSHSMTKGLNHHKGLIIRVDGQPTKLLSGSFNWSPTAEKSNFENLMVFDRSVEGERDLLYDYAAEFDSFFGETDIALSGSDARAYRSWLFSQVEFEVGEGTDPGPPPTPQTPGSSSGNSGNAGGVVGDCDNGGNNTLATLADHLAGVHHKLDPLNINNASVSMLRNFLGLSAEKARRIYNERINGGAYTSNQDFIDRTELGGQMPTDWEKKSVFGDGRTAINEANVEELGGLPGINGQLAKAIADYRETHGEFETIDDLLLVPGIGPNRLATLRPWATAEYSKVFFSSRRLGEEADTGYAAVNDNKTTLVKEGVGATRVDGSLDQPFIDLMRRAKPNQVIKIATYGLSSSTQEFKELANAARRGAKLRVILNKTYSSSTVAALGNLVTTEGLDIEVRIPTKTMHEKFGILGDDLFNGSANLSASSTYKHSEDRFIFKNNPGLAAKFDARFDQIWGISRVRVDTNGPTS